MTAPAASRIDMRRSKNDGQLSSLGNGMYKGLKVI
jgi:hypothetical protein